MDIVHLIFELLTAFVPMDIGKRSQLRSKAEAWYAKVTGQNLVKQVDGTFLDPKTNETHPAPKGIAKFVADYGEEWYVQIGLAFLFIPLKIWLHREMHPEIDPTTKL